jgi:predicted deacylase
MQLLSAIATTVALAGAASATNFTGDVLNGVPVIHDLTLEDVPAQAVSRYYLRVGEINGGHPVHIPVLVARGTPESLETGTKLSLSATIHGDELNPVRVVQRMFEQLEHQVATLNGTGMTVTSCKRITANSHLVIGIPTINPMGIYLNQRNYFTAGSSGSLTNVNRIFPGVAASEGGSGPDILAYNIWNHIWGNTSNVDVGIDLRT